MSESEKHAQEYKESKDQAQETQGGSQASGTSCNQGGCGCKKSQKEEESASNGLNGFLVKQYTQFLEDRISSITVEKLKPDHVDLNKPGSRKVHNYLSKLLLDMTNDIFLKNRTSIIEHFQKCADGLTNDLFTEAEAVDLELFIKSDLGKKIIRNLDIVCEPYIVATKIIADEVAMAFYTQDVNEAITQLLLDSMNESQE